ncbi:serine/threonine protein kinase [Rhodotorula toruloides]|uniref:Serine/threonine protein kinase n=1 Tax=Rhodotorula toruloides TaxID=5286 RepID=A0A511KMW4_RHOTO|nr:serine/threonine protein kinase [Rhodotorula toruloides]
MGFAPAPASLAALSPLLHSRYDLLEDIGVGGTGFCLKVQRRTDSAVFAAKVIAKNRLSKSSLIRTYSWGTVPPGFQPDVDGLLVVPLEAYVLRKVDHPGVCAFVDLFADSRFFYIIMEHHGTSWQSGDASSSLPPSPPITPPSRHLPLEPSDVPNLSLTRPARPASPLMLRRSSSDLFDCTERHHCFGEVLARFIFCQIVTTVCDLAHAGIMHRDIKDENVTVEEGSWKVKLVDFGSAVLFNPAGPAPIQNEKRFHGTCTYAAPEVFAGRAYAMPPADVWSLGVLLHVLLSGELPFNSPADAMHGRRRQTEAVLSAAAVDVLDRCMAVKVEERISLDELLAHPWVCGKYLQ